MASSVPSMDRLNEFIEGFKIIDYDDLKNGNIVYLYLHFNSNMATLVNEVSSFQAFHHILKHSLRSSFVALLKKYKYLKKHYIKYWKDLDEFMKREYKAPIPKTADKAILSDAPKSPIISTAYTENTHQVSPGPTPVLRGDCTNCAHRRQTFSHLKRRSLLFQQRASEKSKQIREICAKYNVKHFNRYKNRKHDQLQRLKDKIKQLEKENSRLQRWLAKLHKKTDDVKKLKRTLHQTNESSKEKIKELKELQHQIKEDRRSVDDIRSTLCSRDEGNTVLEVMRGTSFSLPIRLCLYKCLMSNVSTECAGPLISFIYCQLTNNSLSCIPSAPTVSHLAYELMALTYIQGAEFIINSTSPVTLSWDATTVSGSHINEVHVSSKNSIGGIDNCTLQIEELGGGTAKDYSSHIVKVITDVANIYSQYTDTSNNEIFQQITSKFGSYMTDRCPVNDAAARLLKDAFHSELLSLKCLVHPLDTIASAARLSLKQREPLHNISSQSYGKDCAAANVLNALNTLRFKAGVGDPQGLSNFFKKQNVPTGLVVRYVGNRLHILFHMAIIVFIHRDLFILFLDPKNGRDSSLKQALFMDLNNEYIVTELQALGLLGKIITGPWMSAFYRDGTHMDSVPKLKKSYDCLKELKNDPSLYGKTKNDIFGDPISDCDAMSRLQSSPTPLLLDLLESLSSSLITVFERQLQHYLPGGIYSNPSSDVIQKSSGAPMHNMASERTLGVADGTWRRAPNACIGFISGKTAAKMNNILFWFLSKTPSDRHRLVEFCIPLGYKFHKECSSHAAIVSNEISRRHKEARLKKEASDRRALEKAVKNAVSTKSLQEVNSLQSTLHLDINKAREFILNPPLLVNQLINHTWEEEEDQVSVWNGRVKKLKQRKGSHLAVVAYWALDQDECFSVDYDIKVEALLADMIAGDLRI